MDKIAIFEIVKSGILITGFTEASKGILSQGCLPCGGRPVCVLDFREMEGTRCYLDPSSMEAIRDSISPFPVTVTKGSPYRIHYIDTGEYHYMSALFMDTVRSPFSLLMLDNHTDMQDGAFGEELLSCGNWLAHEMEANHFLTEVRLMGPDSMARLYRRDSGGNMELVDSRPLPPGSIPEEVFPPLQGPVYISVDKDIMSEKYYRTGWSQGAYSLSDVEAIIVSSLSADAGVIGVDVCGGLPPGACLSCDVTMNAALDGKLIEFIDNKLNII